MWEFTAPAPPACPIHLPLHTHSCSSSSCVTLAPPGTSLPPPRPELSLLTGPGNRPSPISSSHSHFSGKVPTLPAVPRRAHADTGPEGRAPARPRARQLLGIWWLRNATDKLFTPVLRGGGATDGWKLLSLELCWSCLNKSGATCVSTLGTFPGMLNSHRLVSVQTKRATSTKSQVSFSF